MLANQMLRQKNQEDLLQLKEQLNAELSECSEVRATYRNKVAAFLEQRGICLLYTSPSARDCS